MNDQQVSIVIADDDRFFRELLKIVAQVSGWTVVAEACDGNEAILLYQQHQPDMLWLDMNMPNLSGEQALLQILAVQPEAIVVMLTGQEDSDKVQACVEAGAAAYVAKAEISAMVLDLQNVWQKLNQLV